MPTSADSLLDALLASSPIAFALVDTELRCLRTSDHLAELTGEPVTALHGRALRELLPDIAHLLEPTVLRVFLTREPVRNMEMEGGIGQRSERDWLVTAFPVMSGNGSVERAAILLVDIGAQKRVEKGVADLLERERRAHERLERLQAVSVGLTRAATAAQVADLVLSEGVAALKADAGAVVLLDPTETHLELVHAQGYPPELAARWRALPVAARCGASRAVSTRRAVWFSATPLFPWPRESIPFSRTAGVVPLMSDDRALGALVFNLARGRRLDPSDKAVARGLAAQAAQAFERARLFEVEQRARSEAERAAHAREELVAILSHDLRSPLATLKGSVQLLRRRTDRAESVDAVRSDLDRIEAAADALTRQLDEVVDASRLRANQPLELSREPMDLVQLVRDVLALMEPQTQRHQLLVEAQAPEIVGSWDRTRLQRVLENLVGNAVKYSPGGGAIVVAVGRRRKWAVFSVRDEGIGIPSADLSSIFEAFHRGRNVTGQVAGTGLGLAGARQVVEQHGGRIDVESAEGRGSTFTVWLPLSGAVEGAHT